MVHSNLALALSAASVLVATAFTAATLERWLARRRRHDLAWAAAMALFAVGALAYFSGVANGWQPWSFKLFYLAGGVLTVPVLAVGTIYLLGGRRLGDRVALAVALVGSFSVGVVLTAPLLRPLDPDRLNAGREVLGVGPRILAAVGSGLGATVVIAGALWSAWRLWRSGRRPGADAAGAPPAAAGRVAAANVAIAAGTLLISVKRPFEVLTGSDETGFALALSVGLAVMFAGFLLASTPSRATVGASSPRTGFGVPGTSNRRRIGVPRSRIDIPKGPHVRDLIRAAELGEREVDDGDDGPSSRRGFPPALRRGTCRPRSSPFLLRGDEEETDGVASVEVADQRGGRFDAAFAGPGRRRAASTARTVTRSGCRRRTGGIRRSAARRPAIPHRSRGGQHGARPQLDIRTRASRPARWRAVRLERLVERPIPNSTLPVW